MKKPLFIFGILISLSVIACNVRPDGAEDSSDGTAAPGGSPVHADSLKPVASPVNEPGSNKLNTDTFKIGYPSDSLNKKKPRS